MELLDFLKYTNYHILTFFFCPCPHDMQDLGSLLLLLLLLSRFSRVRLCATAETAAHPSL